MLPMRIRVGFELAYEFVAPTPMVLMLNVHPSRAIDLIKSDYLHTTPMLPMTRYVDAFGNICTRLVAPKGELQISADAVVADSGIPDAVNPMAPQHEVSELPHETLVFLLGSRYCETERLMNEAWSLFGKTPAGWPRVQAICDYVSSVVRFGYQHARATRTAAEVALERCGVCRDFTHLAVTLCRCMTSRRVIAPAISAISELSPIPIPWISAPGSRSISAVAGTPSTPVTTRRASAASSWRAGVMPPTWRSAPRSVPIRSSALWCTPTR